MTLSSVVESYIVHKRSLGMLFNRDAVLLRAYVKAIGDVDIRRIRPADVRRFLYGVGPVTAYWFSSITRSTRMFDGVEPRDARIRRCTSVHAGPRGRRSRPYLRGASIVAASPVWHQRLESANRKNWRSWFTTKDDSHQL